MISFGLGPDWSFELDYKKMQSYSGPIVGYIPPGLPDFKVPDFKIFKIHFARLEQIPYPEADFCLKLVGSTEETCNFF